MHYLISDRTRELYIRNTIKKGYLDFDDIAINGNKWLTEYYYSVLFGYISIKAIDEENKKLKAHTEELG